MDHQQGTNDGLRELALFAGAGGGILGGKLLGWRTICAVEIEPYAASVLVARQNDGILAPFPIWDDICTFDGKPWRGLVDVVSGGFPCQDISSAGKGAGINGERSGLWREMARVIREVGPRFVLVENSPVLTSRGLGTVLGDLASMGYDAKWGVLGAIDAGAPHRRERIWIMAHTRYLRGRHWTEPAQPEISETSRLRHDGWQQVSFAADCIGWDDDEFGDECSICGLDYCDDCTCPGPTQDGYEYQEFGGTLYARFVADSQIKRLEGRDMRESKPDVAGLGKSCWPKPRQWESEPDLGRVAHGVAARMDRLKAIGNGQVPAVVELAWKALSE